MTRARDISNVITDADLAGDIDVDGTANLDVVDIDGAVDMASTLTVGGLTTLNGKFLIDGSNNDLMTFRTTGDTASQVLGLQFQNNSEAVTAQIFGTGDNSTSGVFRIKGIGNVDIIGGDVGVTGADADLRVHSGGVVSIPNGVALGVGTANTASNVLDDYEEGTWTPSLEASSVDPTVSYTANRSGSYIKIGDVVHVMGRVNTSSVSGGSGNALITGLPFATGAERNAGAVGYISQVSNSSGYTTTGLNPDASASSMRIVQSGSGVGGATVSIGNIGNGFDLTFSHTYKV